jgi:hypothetical protein
LQAKKLIDSKVLEQLIRVQIDAGCSRGSQRDPLFWRVPRLTHDLRSKDGEGKRIRLPSRFAGLAQQLVSSLCGRTDVGKRGVWRFLTQRKSHRIDRSYVSPELSAWLSFGLLNSSLRQRLLEASFPILEKRTPKAPIRHRRRRFSPASSILQKTTAGTLYTSYILLSVGRHKHYQHFQLGFDLDRDRGGSTISDGAVSGISA